MDVTLLVLMFPIMCCEEMKKNKDVFLNLELCFNVTALVYDFWVLIFLVPWKFIIVFYNDQLKILRLIQSFLCLVIIFTV